MVFAEEKDQMAKRFTKMRRPNIHSTTYADLGPIFELDMLCIIILKKHILCDWVVGENVSETQGIAIVIVASW